MFDISYGNYSHLKRGKDLWNRVYMCAHVVVCFGVCGLVYFPPVPAYMHVGGLRCVCAKIMVHPWGHLSRLASTVKTILSSDVD